MHRSGGQDDFPPGVRDLAHPIDFILDADRTGAVEKDPGRECTSDDLQVRTARDRVQKGC